MTNETRSEPVTYSITLATRSEQNPYVAELQAIAMALRNMPQFVRNRRIAVFSSNQAALQAIAKPRQESGQRSLSQIYKATRALETRKNQISLAWIPADTDFPLRQKAKAAARESTGPENRPSTLVYQAKSTVLRTATAPITENRQLPVGVGKYSKELDKAIPGRHTLKLYNAFKRIEANILVQLRTGMARLNGYLYQIGVAEMAICPCEQAVETVKHFLFRCSKWTQQRTQLYQTTETKRGNLSFYLGGKTWLDPESWAPDMKAVRAVVAFAIATGRLQPE